MSQQSPVRWPETASTAAAWLTQYFPAGAVWSRRSDGLVWAYAAAVGLSLVRARNRILDMLVECDPRTATQLLEDWEAELDPYDCVARPSTLAERRKATAARFAAYGGQSAAYIEAVAAAAGYDISVEKAHPWRVDGSPIDAPIRDDAWIWTFLVHVADLGPVTHWNVGVSPIDAPLTDYEVSPLACLIEQIKPAHGTAHFTAP